MHAGPGTHAQHHSPPKACNLWTQESHANRIQALIARPETDYGRRLAPIGFEFGLPEKYRRSACILHCLASDPIGCLHHYGKGNALLPEQRLMAGDKFQICSAMGLEIHDHQARPLAVDVGQALNKEGLAGLGRADMPDFRCPMCSQHTGQQMRRVAVIINQRDEGRIVGYNVQKSPLPRRRGCYATKRQRCPRTDLELGQVVYFDL